jgi:hypothetical protein
VRLTKTAAANPVALLPSISAPAANPTALPVAPRRLRDKTIWDRW